MSDLIVRTVGEVGRLTLNRPAALNALTPGMITGMTRALLAWRDDPAVRAVVVDAAGDRAFCAGADIRWLAEVGASGDGQAETFFREEYRLNQLIARYPKAYVALIDGVTMGGGMGVSIHGSFRVATEATVCAMPETAIGLYPDIGATWFLPRLPGETGTWMGLTGARLTAADALALGIATHVAPRARLGALVEALEAAAIGHELDADGGAVEATIAAFETDPGEAEIAVHRPAIDRLFRHDRVEDILAALRADGSEWAAAQADALSARSPTSLTLTLRALRDGADLTLEEALVRELGFSVGCLAAGADFYEGVRAVVIDKDHAPRWSPARLDAVADADVEAFFAPAARRDITFLSSSVDVG